MIAADAAIGKFIKDVPTFSALPDDKISIIEKVAQVVDYRKNSHIYHQGDEADNLYIIKNGWVRIYRDNVGGEETVAGILSKGEILGERSVIPGTGRYLFSAQAIETSSIIKIPGSAVRGWSETHPLILRWIMMSLIERMNKIHVQNEHLSLMNAAQRVACLLLRLSSHMIGNGGTFTMPYDKHLAAAQLGMKRETFSRALATLKDVGVKVKGSEIRIESFSALSEFCCMQCSLEQEECSGRRCQSCVARNCVPKLKAQNSNVQQLSMDLTNPPYARRA